MSNKTQLCVGDRVNVVQWVGRDGEEPVVGATDYQITEIDGYRCMIAELKDDGSACRPQPFDLSMLRRTK